MRANVYSLPAFDSVADGDAKASGTTRSRRSDLGGGKARTEFELTLVDYATLEPRVPDLTLAVSGPEGARQLSIRGRPLKFQQPGRGGRSDVAGARAPWAEAAGRGQGPELPLGLDPGRAGARPRVLRCAQAIRETNASQPKRPPRPSRTTWPWSASPPCAPTGPWYARARARSDLRALGDRPRLSRCAAPVQRARSDQRRARGGAAPSPPHWPGSSPP